MTYIRRASPLHAARAGAGCAYCAALGVLAVAATNPIVLGGVLVAVIGAGLAAGVAPALRRAALLGLPFALVIAAINPIVDHNGLTVIARAGDLPWLGHVDVTLEALVYGAALGVRALAVILAAGLYAAAVDPDDVLRLFRRVSFRSALTATLATRMLPVLQRDARRQADAQRCRPGRPAPRLAVVRSTASNALDRAMDVAATLELRGYRTARSPAVRARTPWSRHDLAFAAAAAALLAVAIAGTGAGLARLDAYPRLAMATGAGPLALAAVIVTCTLLPFVDRRGIER